MAFGYNFDKNTCDKCGITKEEAKKFPVATGINHPEYRTTTSFSLSQDGGVLCARCNREAEIKSCMDAMDRYAEKHGEKKLAKLCGIKA